MKRAVAILGPTPSFVRWAVRHECPFREIESDDLPYQTFRQLRSLRELSNGSLENRIIDGICIHSEFNLEPETARGFPVDEVYSLFGSNDQVESTCTVCPANSVRHIHPDAQTSTPGWAGCYGWLRSSFEQCNWIDRFQDAVERKALLINDFPDARRVWYRIWQINSWSGQQLEQLAEILSAVKALKKTNCVEFLDLHRSVRSCVENKLVLESELVPAGDSNGLEWKIESHCSRCRVEIDESETTCRECGSAATPNRSQKKKVLGLRPYMLLKDLLGIEKTSKLLVEFYRQP